MRDYVFEKIYGSANPVEIKKAIGFDPTDFTEENIDKITDLYYESRQGEYIYFLVGMLSAISSSIKDLNQECLPYSVLNKTFRELCIEKFGAYDTRSKLSAVSSYFCGWIAPSLKGIETPQLTSVRDWLLVLMNDEKSNIDDDFRDPLVFQGRIISMALCDEDGPEKFFFEQPESTVFKVIWS